MGRQHWLKRGRGRTGPDHRACCTNPLRPSEKPCAEKPCAEKTTSQDATGTTITGSGWAGVVLKTTGDDWCNRLFYFDPGANGNGGGGKAGWASGRGTVAGVSCAVFCFSADALANAEKKLW